MPPGFLRVFAAQQTPGKIQRKHRDSVNLNRASPNEVHIFAVAAGQSLRESKQLALERTQRKNSQGTFEDVPRVCSEWRLGDSRKNRRILLVGTLFG